MVRAIAALVAALGLAPAIGGIARAGGAEALVYVAGPRTSADLYAVRADGSHLRRLTRTAEREWQPSASPDGRTIAFIRGRSRISSSVLTMPTSGGRTTRVAHGSDRAGWAPDGSRLVFVRWAGRHGVELVTARRDGRAPRVLWATLDGGIGRPSWSPDGAWIAFDREQKVDHCWAIRAVGGPRIDLTPDDDACFGVAGWSPSSAVVAVLRVSYDPYGTVSAKLSVVDPAGAIRDVTPTSSGAFVTAWSPDATTIAYATENTVWAVASDGGQPRRLVSVPGIVRALGYSPSGRLAIGTSTSIYVAAADGGGLHRVARNVVADARGRPQFTWTRG